MVYSFKTTCDRFDLLSSMVNAAISVSDMYIDDKRNKATHFCVLRNRLYLLNYVCGEFEGIAVALPLKMPPPMAASFCEQWLTEQNYPNQPDTDGSTKKGYTVSSGMGMIRGWGQHENKDGIGFEHGVLVCVYPAWIVYGK